MCNKSKIAGERSLEFVKDFPSVKIYFFTAIFVVSFTGEGFCVTFSKTIQLFSEGLDFPGLFLFYESQGLDLFFQTIFLLPQDVDLLVFVFVTVFFDFFCLEFSFLFFVLFFDSLFFVLKLILQELDLFLELSDFCFEVFLFVNEDREFEVKFVGEIFEGVIGSEGLIVEWEFGHGRDF